MYIRTVRSYFPSHLIYQVIGMGETIGRTPLKVIAHLAAKRPVGALSFFRQGLFRLNIPPIPVGFTQGGMY